jgi:uncharacterized C2H2 Zn-finger protein
MSKNSRHRDKYDFDVSFETAKIKTKLCPRCGARIRMSAYNDHLVRDHQVNPPPKPKPGVGGKILCQICGKSFRTKNDYNNHICTTPGTSVRTISGGLPGSGK